MHTETVQTNRTTFVRLQKEYSLTIKIAVNLCTKNRPDELRRCISSLIEQHIPAGVDFYVVVVDNDPSMSAKNIVKLFKKNYNNIYYLCAPDPGIPQARNAGLNFTHKKGADWIAIIDDDESVQSDWVENYYNAACTYDVDLYFGPCFLLTVNNPPSWFSVRNKYQPKTGYPVLKKSTANVFMSAKVTSYDGFGLRFDERLRHSGGSDVEFFQIAEEHGCKSIAVQEAIAFEWMPPERLTLGYHYRRKVRLSQNKADMGKARKRNFVTVMKLVSNIITNFFQLLFLLIFSVPFIFFHFRMFRKLMIEVVNKVARIHGIVIGLMKISNDIYK